MSEEQQRKERVSVNFEIFDQVKRLYNNKNKLLFISKNSLFIFKKPGNTIKTVAQ